MIGQPLKMKCKVCRTSWTDDSHKPSRRKSEIKDKITIPAPCGHGNAFLVRFYDANEDVWYYHR